MAVIRDLAARLAHRVQLTTDRHKVYFEAVEGALGADVDNAMLVQMYGGDSCSAKSAETRYSPPCIGTRTVCITGQLTRPCA